MSFFNFVKQWGKTGTETGEFKYPNGIACDERHVAVADTWNHRIQLFDLSGNFISRIGGYGTENGMFCAPYGVAIFNNTIFVTDYSNNRVQLLSMEGTFISSFSTPNSPYGIAVDESLIHISTSDHAMITYK